MCFSITFGHESSLVYKPDHKLMTVYEVRSHKNWHIYLLQTIRYRNTSSSLPVNNLCVEKMLDRRHFFSHLLKLFTAYSQNLNHIYEWWYTQWKYFPKSISKTILYDLVKFTHSHWFFRHWCLSIRVKIL